MGTVHTNVEDITIYYPIKCNGLYTAMPYSFYGIIVSLSDAKDAFNFIKKSFLTEEECQKECDKYNEHKKAICEI